MGLRQTFILVLLFRCSPAFCADLVQVFADASAADKILASARQTYLADQQKFPEAITAFLPRISASATGSRHNFEQQKLPNVSYSANGYTVTLTQPLFNWSDMMALQQSRIEASMAELTLRQAEQDLIERVCSAYFAVLASQDDLSLALSHERTLGEQLEAARHTQREGNGTVVDVAEAQAAYELSRSDELDARGKLDGAQARLAEIVGHPIDALLPLRQADPVLPDADPPRIDEWMQQARDSSYDVLLKQLAQRDAHYGKERTRGDYMPTLSLVAHHSHGNGVYMNDESFMNINGRVARSNDVGVQLTIPLFDGFSTHERLKEKEILEQKASIDADRARDDAALAARQAFTDLETALAKVRSLQVATRTAALALDANRKGLRAGVRIEVDVIDAEEKRYASQRDLAHAVYAALLASVQLKKAAAALSEDDIHRLNALLAH